jgi:hypothetical protein
MQSLKEQQLKKFNLFTLAVLLATGFQNKSFASAAALDPTRSVISEELALSLGRSIRYQTASADPLIPISEHTQILPEIERVIYNAGSNNLVVFYDIDDCLTMPINPACLPCSYAKRHKAEFSSLTAHLSPVESSIVWNLKYTEHGARLTEPGIPDILKMIQESDVKTYGLTASMAGKIGDVTESNHRRRVAVLKDLGIDFGQRDLEFVFDEFPPFHESPPVYYNGVCFSQTSGDHGSTTKGELIIALLRRLKMKPTHVMLVDDSKRNLDRFDFDMKSHGITPISVLYKSDEVHKDREISVAEYRATIADLVTKAKTATKRPMK